MLSLTVQWDVLRNMPQAIFWTFLQNEFDIAGRIIADQVIQFEILIYIVCKSILDSIAINQNQLFLQTVQLIHFPLF